MTDRKTVTNWALITCGVLLIPLGALLWVTIGTKADTGDIKAAQEEARAATDAAVRNGAVSACQARYARTAAVHQSSAATLDQHAETLFAELIQLAEADASDAEVDAKLTDYTEATVAAEEATDLLDEVNRRGLGVAVLAGLDVDEPFTCPAIPGRLVIPAIDPTDPNPPGP